MMPQNMMPQNIFAQRMGMQPQFNSGARIGPPMGVPVAGAGFSQLARPMPAIGLQRPMLPAGIGPAQLPQPMQPQPGPPQAGMQQPPQPAQNFLRQRLMTAY